MRKFDLEYESKATQLSKEEEVLVKKISAIKRDGLVLNCDPGC